MSKYPNIEAVLSGAVSGQATEWPMLRAELRALTAELAARKRTAPLCDKHQPSGGTRGVCVICAGEAQSAALSRISYDCGEPNEMGVSLYDCEPHEWVVVGQVERLTAELAALRAGGCARDQGSTQWCAEAVAMQAERDKYRDTLLSRHGGECLALLSELDEARAELAACGRDAERLDWLDRHLRDFGITIGGKITCEDGRGEFIGYFKNLRDAIDRAGADHFAALEEERALAATAHPAGGDK